MTVPVLTIGIAGGTGAGKTTLAKRIFDRLRGDENINYLIHDYYYKDITDKPMEERAKTNFDHPESLDTDLLIQHIRDLKQGKSVQVPKYDFTTHSRCEEYQNMEPKNIILVEGILIFCNQELVDELDVKVFVDAESDIRLIRRLNRDCAERGRSFEEVIRQYSDTVRPMHEEWVEPSKKRADLIVYSQGHSMDVAIEMLVNHLCVTAGIDPKIEAPL